MKKKFKILVLLGVAAVIGLSGLPAVAKKKKGGEPPASSPLSASEERVNGLSADEKRQFDSLSEHQQKMIRQGKVEEGYNEWMVQLALGNPYSDTTTHPEFPEYERVLIYTKPDVQNRVSEEKIIDPQTNWPTIHRKTYKKTCTVGDFFVLFDREVVQKIVPDHEQKVHGSCTVETSEAFLPIVDGKPVEPVQPVEPK